MTNYNPHRTESSQLREWGYDPEAHYLTRDGLVYSLYTGALVGRLGQRL